MKRKKSETSSPASAVTHGESKTIIDKKHIISLKRRLKESYPDSESYPEADLNSAYISNSQSDERSKRYNPFNLRLPYELTGYSYLFQHSLISDEKSYYYRLYAHSSSRRNCARTICYTKHR